MKRSKFGSQQVMVSVKRSGSLLTVPDRNQVRAIVEHSARFKNDRGIELHHVHPASPLQVEGGFKVGTCHPDNLVPLGRSINRSIKANQPDSNITAGDFMIVPTTQSNLTAEEINNYSLKLNGATVAELFKQEGAAFKGMVSFSADSAELTKEEKEQKSAEREAALALETDPTFGSYTRYILHLLREKRAFIKKLDPLLLEAMTLFEKAYDELQLVQSGSVFCPMVYSQWEEQGKPSPTFTHDELREIAAQILIVKDVAQLIQDMHKAFSESPFSKFKPKTFEQLLAEA
ncbi:hypothetical protein F9H62_01755 [Vibrio alginolyticus]|nr:hypothetical protein [Vibrio alginolyticus]